jgi:Na+-driven multidrug efflux pump
MGARQIPGAFFQGIGRGLPALIIGLTREFILILPLVYILSTLIGRMGLWLTFPISDVLGAILALVWIFIVARRMGLRFHLIYPNSSSSVEEGETNDEQ